MMPILNRKAAEAYSQDFTHKILNDFFSSHTTASGQDLLEITPVQQVNLLLIQRLYQRWQEETLRLRSPYFNYEHPQVQESLKHFMNILSRHIQVDKAALEPLMVGAVEDTLRLLYAPIDFFRALLSANASVEGLQSSLRYLRLQQAITDALQEQAEQKETIDPEYLLAMLGEGLQSGRLELEPADEYRQAFEAVLPFPQQLIATPEEEKPTPAPPQEEATDFFSSISRTAPRSPKPAPAPANKPEPETSPRAAAEASQEARPEPAPQAPKAASTSFTPDHTVDTQLKPVIPTQQLAPSGKSSTLSSSAADQGPSIGKQEEEERSLNKRFSEQTDKKPLYERFETKEPRSNTIAQKQRSTNIRHYITLNQRFMYVKELFGGNAAAFNQALDQIDACNNLQEAQAWLDQHLAGNPQWQEETEAAQEFQRIVSMRFGS